MSEEIRSFRDRPVTIGQILVVVVALGAIACIMAVITIAILALLGPQIGNVFSQINDGLSTTPLP